MSNDFVKFKINGLDQIQKALEELPLKAAKKIEGHTLKDAAQITVKEMATRAPKDTGLLAEHFGSKISMRGTGKNLAARVRIGGLTGVKYDPPETFRKKFKDTIGWGVATINRALHFLEFGSVHEKKRPFLSQSWESTKNSVLAKFIADIKEALGL